MPFPFTDEGRMLLDQVQQFMDDHIYPAEEEYEEQSLKAGLDADPPLLDELCAKARERGLWNMFLPDLRPGAPGTRLSNLDYAPVSEELGKVPFAALVFNCAAPDTGNMEILNHFATPTVKARWLEPLLDGTIRSAFSMTEPEVASSDATNVTLRIERDGDEYVLNGSKWFSTGATRDRCEVLIVMGKTDPQAPRHRQQSMIVVPRDTAGVHVARRPTVFGYEEVGGHPEILYHDVRVPVENLLGDEGGGFAIAQARLGPGRIHHCMRTIGVAERALSLMVERALQRTAFGTTIAHKGLIQDWIAESRIEIDMARQYVLHTADLMDTVGNKGAASEIAGIKVAVPNVALKVIDRAIQVFGAAGVTQYTPLAGMYASMRTLRIADGPDEVHKMTIARRELLRRDPSFRMNPDAGRPGRPEEEPVPFARP